MNMKNMLILTLLATILGCGACCGAPAKAQTDASVVFGKIDANYKKIKDYKASVLMTIKGPQMSINRMPMTIYYKQPDKFKIESKEGPAFAPPGMFGKNPGADFVKDASLVYVKTETYNGISCWVYKTSGRSPVEDAVMIRVDPKRMVVLSMESTGNWKMKSQWDYTKVNGLYLPSRIRAEMVTPAMSAGHRHKAPAQQAKASKSSADVKISSYVLNKGLSDSIFAEKSRKK